MHPTDPLYGQQWHLTRLGNIEKIWDEYSGAGVHVGIYDSGIDLDHPDLASNYDPTGRLFFNGVPLDEEPTVTPTGPNGHGTAVVGVISAAANNGEGGIGVAWGSTFTSVVVLDPNSPIADDEEAQFETLVDFDVTNHSWNALPGVGYTPYANVYGGDTYSDVNDQFEYASVNGRGGLGTVLVQATANLNIDAQYSGLNVSRFTISVAGTQEDGSAASFSNYGACVLIAAPSTNFVTTDIVGPDGAASADYTGAADDISGTSLAAPVVTGVVALMLEANPNLGWRDVQNVLAASATHTGSASGDLGTDPAHANENSTWFFNDAANWNGGGMHFSNDYGYGAVNAYNAVRMAEVWSLFGAAETTANEHFSNWEDPTDRAIADNGVLEFTVSLPTLAMTVEHIELRTDITHGDFRQLRIFLTSPNGTETQLYDGSGATDTTADTLLNWTFASEALRGEPISGDWTIRIEDGQAGETGTLNWFNLVAYGAGADANDTYHYTDEFLAMRALGASRGALADGNDGIDWIDAAAVTGDMALNLTAGAASKVNNVDWFTIAAGTTIENAVTGDGNDTLIGNSAINQLRGMRGNDTLNGGAGRDTLIGGNGNDTYVADVFNEIINETSAVLAKGGNDLVQFGGLSGTFTLGLNVERLTLTGTKAVNGTGNTLANTITGNAAANKLDGKTGADTLMGLRGNDTYVVDSTSDVVSEVGGTGIDLVQVGFTFSLANTLRVKGHLDNLTFVGTKVANGTGNTLANTIIGNGAANRLDGGAGNDVLNGGSGKDTLIGGPGKDTLIGGLGLDIFDFNLATESVRGNSRDTVSGFSRAQKDRIDLSTIDADRDGTVGNQKFAFIGTAAFSGVDGQLRFAGGVLAGDTNGDKVADFEIRVTGVTSMVIGDFFL